MNDRPIAPRATEWPRTPCPASSPGRGLAAVALGCLVLALVASRRPVQALSPGELELELVASGFSAPLAIRHAGDGSERLFIVERAGVIRIFDGSGTLAAPFLDLSGIVDTTGGEQGLLGLAFHPEYEANGFFYVNYVRDAAPRDRSVIARYRVSTADPDIADPGSATPLLEVEQDFANHNGGNILFGPDGYLYIGMGDGGGAGDPNNRAQSPSTLLGKMVRIDVDGGGGAPDCGLVGGYSVPLDNPFVDGPGGTCDEIWALGLRNPWRWSFDRLTGDLFIGDVGQASVEEIDFEPAGSPGGRNYGWRCYEGSSPYEPSGCGPRSRYTFPILEYPHPGIGCSVTGGYVYRGSRIAGLRGTYLYADFCSGRIWLATRDDGAWTATLWRDTDFRITTFGEDQEGELYLVEIGGSIYRLTSPIFSDGFETGDASAWSQRTP